MSGTQQGQSQSQSFKQTQSQSQRQSQNPNQTVSFGSQTNQNLSKQELNSVKEFSQRRKTYESNLLADNAGIQYTMFILKVLYEISKMLAGICINQTFKFGCIINSQEVTNVIAKSIFQNLDKEIPDNQQMYGMDQWRQYKKTTAIQDIEKLLNIVNTYIQLPSGGKDNKQVEGDFDLLMKKSKLSLQDDILKFFQKKENDHQKNFWTIRNYLQTQNKDFKGDDQAIYVFQLKRNPFGDRVIKSKETKPVQIWARINQIDLNHYRSLQKNKNRKAQTRTEGDTTQNTKKQKQIQSDQVKNKQTKQKQNKNKKTKRKQKQQQRQKQIMEQQKMKQQIIHQKHQNKNAKIQERKEEKEQHSKQFKVFRQKFLDKLMENNMLENITQIIKLIYAAAQQIYKEDQKYFKFDFHNYRSMRNLGTCQRTVKIDRQKHPRIVLYYVINNSLTEKQFREKFDFFRPILKHLFIYEKAILHIVGCSEVNEEQKLAKMEQRLAQYDKERQEERRKFDQDRRKFDQARQQERRKLHQERQQERRKNQQAMREMKQQLEKVMKQFQLMGQRKNQDDETKKKTNQ